MNGFCHVDDEFVTLCVCVQVLLVFGIADYAVPRYDGNTLPLWVNVLAGMVGMAPLLVAFILLMLDAVRPLKDGQVGTPSAGALRQVGQTQFMDRPVTTPADRYKGRYGSHFGVK